MLVAVRAALVLFAAIVAAVGGYAGSPQVWSQIVVLAVIATIASTSRMGDRLGRGAPVVEALVASASAVAVSTVDINTGLSFLPYVLVPCLVGGLRGGARWAAATVAAAVLTYGTVALLVPAQARDNMQVILGWAAVACTVAALGAYIRGLEERHLEQDSAYVSAHRLLTELWLVARQLSAGLDPVTLAHTMLQHVRDDVGFVRAAVFVRSPGGFLVPLAVDGIDGIDGVVGVDWDTSTRGESLLGAAWAADHPVQEPAGFGGQSDLYRSAFPLRMGVRTFGVIALETQHLVEGTVLRDAMHDAAESALRLETALLFADVRSIASSEERRRLAREIHDGIAQELTSLGYSVDDLVDRAHDRTMKNELHALRHEITRVIGELRLSIFDLRSDISTGSGLGAALSDYVQQMGAAARGPTIHLVLDESPQRLRLDTEVELLRIAQEAITNARKHSAADNLWVTCRVAPPDAFLSIEDDGVGMGEGRIDSFGLQVMRERSARIGAQLVVEPRTGGGTRVTVRLGTHDVTGRSPAMNEVDA